MKKNKNQLAIARSTGVQRCPRNNKKEGVNGSGLAVKGLRRHGEVKKKQKGCQNRSRPKKSASGV